MIEIGYRILGRYGYCDAESEKTGGRKTRSAKEDALISPGVADA